MNGGTMTEYRAATKDVGDGWVEVTLVPVQVFGENLCCEHNPHGVDLALNPGYEGVTDCESQGNGLCDAVSWWSDCNRAWGRIYRFEDSTTGTREPGETLTVRVKRDEFEAFIAQRWDDE